MDTNLPGVHVVQIRYHGSDPVSSQSDPVPAYAASGAYNVLGIPTIVEPAFPEDRRVEEPTDNLGIFGGEIAAAVSEGRRAGRPVLVLGGNCASVPGVIGGLQHDAERHLGQEDHQWRPRSALHRGCWRTRRAHCRPRSRLCARAP